VGHAHGVVPEGRCKRGAYVGGALRVTEIRARGLPAGWTVATVLVLAAALLLGLAIGPVSTGIWPVASSALSHLPFAGIHSHLGSTESAIVWQLRAPRVVLAALVGGMLAIAGSAYQGAFRNPLVDPYLLGAAAGAGLGATLAITQSLSGGLLPVAAFLGASVAVFGAYVLGRSVGGVRSTGTLILAGVT